MRHIGRVESDIREHLWHLAHQVERLAVGISRVNPQAVERNNCIVGEAAIALGSGFASTTNSICRHRGCVLREVYNTRQRHRRFPVVSSSFDRSKSTRSSDSPATVMVNSNQWCDGLNRRAYLEWVKNTSDERVWV